MVILRSQNKNTDFFIISALLCLFDKRHKQAESINQGKITASAFCLLCQQLNNNPSKRPILEPDIITAQAENPPSKHVDTMYS